MAMTGVENFVNVEWLKSAVERQKKLAGEGVTDKEIQFAVWNNYGDNFWVVWENGKLGVVHYTRYPSITFLSALKSQLFYAACVARVAAGMEPRLISDYRIPESAHSSRRTSTTVIAEMAEDAKSFSFSSPEIGEKFAQAMAYSTKG